MILYAFINLSMGIFSIISEGEIHLLYSKFSHLPLNLLGTLTFLFKVIFNTILGLGFIATGLFIGLNSDVMYLPAIAGAIIGLGSQMAISLLF
ncbi:MAG: hypothetical protein JXQ76_10700 [Campylobacterales bacterium]|nr:hypothetical protein [Campylobacterales bacterium]